MLVQPVRHAELLQSTCLLASFRSTGVVGDFRVYEIGEVEPALDDVTHTDLSAQDLQGFQLRTPAQKRDEKERQPNGDEEETARAVVDDEERDCAADDDHDADEGNYYPKPGLKLRPKHRLTIRTSPLAT